MAKYFYDNLNVLLLKSIEIFTDPNVIKFILSFLKFFKN